ncbi:MAG: hypothetical protein WBD13_18495 [Burkholderiaceae bacterium]
MKNLIIAIGAFAIASASVAEILPGTDLEVFTESAAIAGTGRTVALRRLPVRNAVTGELNWYDVTFQLSADANGQLRFDAISQIEVSPPVLSTSSFRSGFWQEATGSVYKVSGPAVGTNGYEVYTLRKHTGDHEDLAINWSTEPMSSQFQGNRDYTDSSSLYDAKDAEYAFGTANFLEPGRSSSHPFYLFDSEFIGVRTIGNDILMFSRWINGVLLREIPLTYIGPIAN